MRSDSDQGPAGSQEPEEQPASLPSVFVGYNPFAAACPTRQVLGIIADKWTSLVIVLLAQGTKRFQQLRREIDGITQKMLTQTLRELEHNGLVSRRVYAQVPPKVEYALTPLGRTLIEPLAALHEWSIAHVEEIEAARVASSARDAASASEEGEARTEV